MQRQITDGEKEFLEYMQKFKSEENREFWFWVIAGALTTLGQLIYALLTKGG